MVGRQREIDALHRFAASLAAGHGGFMVLEGEPGLGKSRLLDELAGQATQAGIRCARGQGAALDSGRPFGALMGALDLREGSLDPSAAAIGRLLDRRTGGAPYEEGDGWRLTDAVVDHVERLVARGPLLLVIDDLQWADMSTLRVLTGLGHLVASAPLGISVAYRPLPRMAARDALLECFRDSGPTTLRLAGLSASDVQKLIETVEGAPPGPRLARLAASAGGNPLFVVQLLASLRSEGLLTVDSVVEASSDDVPMNLRHAVERRVRSLPEDTRALLQLACVLGRTFSLDQLAAVAEQDSLDVAHRLRPAFDDGLLGEDGVAVAFRHDLVRDAVYHALPVAEQVALHRRIARRLSTIGAAPARIAEHLAVGASRGDVEAVRWLRKAGLEAAAHDSQTAVGYLERALSLSPPSDPRRHGLATALANQLVFVGRTADAEQLIRASLAYTADATSEAMLRAGLGNLLTGSGKLVAARAEYLRAAAVVDDIVMALSLRAAAGTMAAYAGDFETAVAELAPIQEEARRYRVGFAQAIATTTLGTARAAAGDLDGAITLYRQSIAITGAGESFWDALNLQHLPLAISLLAADDISGARTALRAGRQLSARRNTESVFSAYDGLLASCDYVEGNWDDAVIGAQAATGRREVGPYLRTPAASIAVLIAAARGELTAVDGATIAGVAAETGGHAIYAIEYADLAACALSLGRESVADELSEAWESRRPFHLPGFAATIGTELVDASFRCGDHTRASTIAEALAALAARAPGIPSLATAALHARGRVEGSTDALLAAADSAETSPRAHLRSRTFADAGIALAERDPNRARRLLTDALDGFMALTATNDVERLVACAQTAGIQLGQRRPPRPRFGWEALTPTELKVIEAVTRGLTNGEIATELYISRHTVESHLKHIFTKLGVRSRSEVAHRGAVHGL